MAKNTDGIGTVGVGSTIDTTATGSPLTTFGENVRGSYRLVNNDSDRDSIDARLLENNMVIYHIAYPNLSLIHISEPTRPY